MIESLYSDDKHLLIIGRAYEDNKARKLAVQQGFIPVVPPKMNHKDL